MYKKQRRFSCSNGLCNIGRKRRFSKKSLKKLRKFSKKLRKYLKNRHSFGRRFRFGSSEMGPTDYQNKVNSLTGAMGPVNTAFWPDMGPVKDPWSLAAQPLYFSGPEQRYEVSPDVNADKLSVLE
jgi:hypothetical protein